MSKDGVLPYRVVADQGTGTTGFAGLGLYVELACALGLLQAVDRHLPAAGGQGWLDRHYVLAGLLLNLSGGDCVDDLERLEQDAGLGLMVRQAEGHGLSNYQRKQLAQRFRKGRQRALPSPSRFRAWLEGFHEASQEELRVPGKAFIPAPNGALRGLAAVNRELVAAVQQRAPQTTATLDCDATLAETGKQEALFCYQGYRAYQPLTVYWAEQGLVVASEFRDGNVPAGYELKRVLAAAVESLPAGVERARLRSDTAGYQHEVMRYCREQGIEFSISADVSPSLRSAAAAVPEDQWRPLGRRGKRHEYAEVVFVPDEAGFKLGEEPLRYVAVREPLEQSPLPGTESQLTLPFATMTCGGRCYKLQAVVTNRDLPGPELLAWHWGRCGKSEEAHAVMKEDLAGGQLPSGKFGANAAWWGLMVLAFNLQAAMARLVLGGPWARKRMKALRLHLIALPGRLVERGRQWYLKVSGAAAARLTAMRRRIRGLARAPAV